MRERERRRQGEAARSISVVSNATYDVPHASDGWRRRYSGGRFALVVFGGAKNIETKMDGS